MCERSIRALKHELYIDAKLYFEATRVQPRVRQRAHGGEGGDRDLKDQNQILRVG